MVSNAQAAQPNQYQGQNTVRSGETEKPSRKNDSKQKEVQGRDHQPVPPPLKSDTKHLPQTAVPLAPAPQQRLGHTSAPHDESTFTPPTEHYAGVIICVVGLTLIFCGLAIGLARWGGSKWKWIKRRDSKWKLIGWWAVAALSLVLSYFVREWPFYLVTEIAWVGLGLTAGWCWINYDRRKINGCAGGAEPLDPHGDVDQLGFFNSRVAMRSLPLFEITIADIPIKGEKNSESSKNAGEGNAPDETPAKEPKLKEEAAGETVVPRPVESGEKVAKVEAEAKKAAAKAKTKETAAKAEAEAKGREAEKAAENARQAREAAEKAEAEAKKAAEEARKATAPAAKPELAKEATEKAQAAAKEAAAKTREADAAKDAAAKAQAEADAAAAPAKAAREAAAEAEAEASEAERRAAAIEAAKKIAGTPQGQRGIAQRLVRQYWGVELKITKCVATPSSVTVYFSEPVISAVDAKIPTRYLLEQDKSKSKETNKASEKQDAGTQEHKPEEKTPGGGGTVTSGV